MLLDPRRAAPHAEGLFAESFAVLANPALNFCEVTLQVAHLLSKRLLMFSVGLYFAQAEHFVPTDELVWRRLVNLAHMVAVNVVASASNITTNETDIITKLAVRVLSIHRFETLYDFQLRSAIGSLCQHIMWDSTASCLFRAKQRP
jgi:hypothetical protein